MIRCQALGVEYPCGTPALKNVSFSVPSGQRLAVIGANGAGKSSLLCALVGLVAFTGSIEINGQALQADTLESARSALGFVFQNPDDQLFSTTVLEDVAFGPLQTGASVETANQTALHVLDTMGIAHLAQKPPYKMSGGEKRMAALAGVLALQPQALLLDEPTAFLDPRARRTLLHVLQSRPEALVVATHDLDFALELCTHVLVLEGGNVAATGSAKEILTNQTLLESVGLELPFRLQAKGDFA